MTHKRPILGIKLYIPNLNPIVKNPGRLQNRKLEFELILNISIFHYESMQNITTYN
jgi:hypothetical protein